MNDIELSHQKVNPFNSKYLKTIYSPKTIEHSI